MRGRKMNSRLPADGCVRLEHYRKKAKEADAKAASAADPQVQMIWTQIARTWRQLAAHLAHDLER
jgi:hypothetical protein